MFCSRSLLITGKLYNKFTRSLVITFKHHFCCHTWEIFLVHVRNPFSVCGGSLSVLFMTLQKYNILIAVYEYFSVFFLKKLTLR